MACRICGQLPCVNPDDLATGIDGALYSALDFSFVVQCPALCHCPDGVFPQTISILASTIPPVVPPIPEPGAPIILRLQGCTSLIIRTLDATATQTQIASAAQSMQAEWAGQQALCLATQVPGVNCQQSDFIDICSDPDSFFCPTTGGTVIIPACFYSQRLNTVGMTQAQIDAASAQIKASLNANAQQHFCPYFKLVCSFTITTLVGGANQVDVNVNNVSAVNAFDSTGILLCIHNTSNCNPFHFNPSVPPLSNLVVTGGLAALYGVSGIDIYNFGVLIFTDLNNAPTGKRIYTIEVGCAG